MKRKNSLNLFYKDDILKKVLCIVSVISLVTLMFPKIVFGEEISEICDSYDEEFSETAVIETEESPVWQEIQNQTSEEQSADTEAVKFETDDLDEVEVTTKDYENTQLYYGVNDGVLYISSVSTDMAKNDATAALSSLSLSAIPWYSKVSSITNVVIQGNPGDIAPTGMAFWFYNMKNCTSIQNLSNINTSNVTSMKDLFYGCMALESIDLSNFNTSNVADMTCMFAGCTSITSLDVSMFDTSNVTLMAGMFEGNLYIPSWDLRNFDTSKVTDMSRMFDENNTLTEINLNYFDTSNVTSMKEMFNHCINLKNVYINGLNTSSLTSSENMFYNCQSIEILDLSTWNTKNITTVAHMFEYCISLKEINFAGWNTQNLTSMLCMFCECQSLEYLDLANFNTSSVTNMNRVFDGCVSLRFVNVSTWNTSNVTGMTGLFKNCQTLESIYVKNFNTEKVENMASMFNGCHTLNLIDLSSFKTYKLWNLASMFEGCSNVETIDLGNAILFDLEGYNTSMVTTFKNCTNLKTVYANPLFSAAQKWDKPAYCRDTFVGCTSLVGGEGTAFSEDHTDALYARVDWASIEFPGYFTEKITHEILIEISDINAGYVVDDKGNIVNKLDVLENSILNVEDNMLSIIPPNKYDNKLFGTSLIPENYIAVANEGYAFKSWEISDDVVDEDITIKVNFEKVSDNPEINPSIVNAQTGDANYLWLWTFIVLVFGTVSVALTTRKSIDIL